MKNKINDKVSMCLVVLFCLCIQYSNAKVKLPTIISDGMVLQREAPIKLCGTSAAGETVDVQFLGSTYQTKANEAGDWKLILPAQNYGGPY